MVPAKPSPEQRSDDVEETDKADRPSAELNRGYRPPKERQADGVVGNVGWEVQTDKCHMETAHKETDREQPEALSVKCFLERIPGALRSDRTGGLWRCRAILAQSEGERDHCHRNGGKHEHR